MRADVEKKYIESNKELWDKKTVVHKSSRFYDVQGFVDGKSALNEIETSELGDVKGKSVLHLQCHFGLDSMSWSRLGANVTGIDFSEVAIAEAKRICLKVGLNTKFICSNIYDLKDHLDSQFDIVFTSYGVIGWLPDLDRWAELIKYYLKPEGTFYMAEFHPFLWMLDDDFKHIKYSYFNQGVIDIDIKGTYTDRDADIEHKEYSWNHSISEVINALINQGMVIEHMSEFDYSPYDCFPNTIKNEEGNYFIKGFEKVLPMVYSIRTRKK